VFKAMDGNGDGQLSLSELNAAIESKGLSVEAEVRAGRLPWIGPH
jgi:hypothetical protein